MATTSRLADIAPLISALDATTEPVEFDDGDGTVIFVNRAWSRLFGEDRDDSCGARWDSLDFASGNEKELRKSWDLCAAEGSAEGRFPLRRPDGPTLTILYDRALLTNVGGAPATVLTVYRVLARPVVVDDTFVSYPLELEASWDAVAVADATGLILSANRAFAVLTGYGRGELKGLHLEVIVPDAARFLDPPVQKLTLSTGSGEVRRKDGNVVVVNMSVTPEMDTYGACAGFVARATALRPAHAMASGIAYAPALHIDQLEHKLKNIFTVIIGCAQMTSDGAADQVSRNRLALIRSAVASGIELLDRI